MTDTIILCLINLITLVIGIKIGISIASKKELTFNPIKAIQENKEEKKEKKAADLKERQIKTMLQNIDNYNGTNFGQQEIPK